MRYTRYAPAAGSLCVWGECFREIKSDSCCEFCQEADTGRLDTGSTIDQYYRQRNGKQGNGIERPGMFQFDFIINGSVYIYGFTFSYMDGTIGKEWLYQRQRERLNRIIFLRNEHGVITKLRMIGRPKTRFEVYARDVQFQPRNLLLSTLAQKSGDDVFQVFSEVYNWFDNLIVIFPDSMPTMSTMPALSAPALPVPPFASHEADLRREFSELLSYFDPGIAAIYSQGVGELLDLSDESAGIQRLLTWCSFCRLTLRIGLLLSMNLTAACIPI